MVKLTIQYFLAKITKLKTFKEVIIRLTNSTNSVGYGETLRTVRLKNLEAIVSYHFFMGQPLTSFPACFCLFSYRNHKAKNIVLW